MDAQNLAVQIVRLVQDGFPGWVECQFNDAAGRVHTVVDKVPVLTTEVLDADSQYPRPGEIQYEVLGRTRDIARGKVVHITTPGIESTEGLSEFVAPALQLPAPTGQASTRKAEKD